MKLWHFFFVFIFIYKIIQIKISSKYIPYLLFFFTISEKNVIWTLFNGEAFDYIGSQRVAYDIKAGRFPPNAPLATSQIKLHLDIGQLGGSLKNSQSSWNLSAFIPYKEWPQQV